MKNQGREILQRLLAILVIVAMLAVMGIPPPVIIFFAFVTYFIWRAVRRTEQQEIVEIFNFYVSASEILRDEERCWYGFEINEVIEHGESVLRWMVDPPPLVHFALGALHHRVGNHESAIEHLSYVTENALGDERQRIKPSPELRRYVQMLRRLEREPGEGPQTLAALRHLGRARRSHAGILLSQSRERLQAVEQQHAATLTPVEQQRLEPVPPTENAASIETLRHTTLTQPPPIAEVLRDLYEKEKTA